MSSSYLMVLYISLLSFLVLLFFHDVLSCRLIFIERDLSAFFIPPQYLWVHLAKSLQLPLWNPHNYSGMPLIATLQPGVFYPPHLLYFLLPFNVAWNWLIILHFIFAGVTIFLLLRYFKASMEGAFAGALCFVFSGYLLSVHSLLPHLFGVAWFPLVVHSFLKYFQGRKSGYLVSTSLVLAMQFLAGAPEIVIMTLVVLAVIALFPLAEVSCRQGDNGGPGSPDGLFFRVRGLVLVVLLFVLLSSLQLVPFYELQSLSVRKHGLDYREAVTWSLGWKDFLQFFVPNLFGNFQNEQKYWANQSWLKTIYLGIIPFIFSLFYFLSSSRKRLVFLLLMAISLVFALGGSTPLYKLLYKVPPFNAVRYPVKFLFLFFFVISVTTGLGMDALRKGIEAGSARASKTIVVIFYAGFAFAVGWGIVTIYAPQVAGWFDHWGIKPDAYNDITFNLHNIRRFLFFSFSSCVALLLFLRLKQKRLMLFGLTALMAADLFLANYGYYVKTPWESFTARHEFMESRPAGPEEPGRYLVTPGTTAAFKTFPADRKTPAAAYAALLGWYGIDGCEVLRVGVYDNFLKLLFSTPSLAHAKRYFPVAGVRYVIANYEIEDRDFRFVRSADVEGKKSLLYEYRAYPGRALIYGKAHFVKDEKAMLDAMVNAGIDLGKELVLLGHDPAVHPGFPAGGAGKIVSYGPNGVAVEYSSPNDAFLYLSDTYYPGWRAYVDGRETPIYRANLTFRAIEVPAGTHKVVFSYVPLSFYAGLVLTLLGIGLSVYLVTRDGRREHHR